MSNLTVTEYKNIRVLTTQQIAEAYGTDTKIISKISAETKKDTLKVSTSFALKEKKEENHRRFSLSS